MYSKSEERVLKRCGLALCYLNRETEVQDLTGTDPTISQQRTAACGLLAFWLFHHQLLCLASSQIAGVTVGQEEEAGKKEPSAHRAD